MTATSLVQQLVNGLSLGSIYALLAVGITMAFGLTGLVNFAYGAFMSLGAYVVYATSPNGGPKFLVALVLAGIVVGLLNVLTERGLFRFTWAKPINGFMVSLGLILILQHTIEAIWGDDLKAVQPIVAGELQIAGITLVWARLVVMGTVVLIFLALYFLIESTWIGMAIRACAMDREAARLTGISVSTVTSIVFALGGAMAGIGGGLVATLYPVTPDIGSTLLLRGFAIALLGGLGNVRGAVVASLCLGVIEALLVQIGFQSWVEPIFFGSMIVVLLIRPEGLIRGVEGARL